MAKFDERKIREKVNYIVVKDPKDTTKIADKLMEGQPIILNLKDCPKEEANQMLFFLEGVNYATDGYPVVLGDSLFLLATKKDLKTPSLVLCIILNKSLDIWIF
ncbi:MAG: cell division protein SepF [Gammaproteobacteria bacterium]|nr:cell division protein SepF [Gammaproteobacteria bacterium]